MSSENPSYHDDFMSAGGILKRFFLGLLGNFGKYWEVLGNIGKVCFESD